MITSVWCIIWTCYHFKEEIPRVLMLVWNDITSCMPIHIIIFNSQCNARITLLKVGHVHRQTVLDEGILPPSEKRNRLSKIKTNCIGILMVCVSVCLYRSKFVSIRRCVCSFVCMIVCWWLVFLSSQGSKGLLFSYSLLWQVSPIGGCCITSVDFYMQMARCTSRLCT